MYEGRDDTLPQASEVLGHFQRNVKLTALNKMREAFKKAWGNNVQYSSPLDFQVSVGFDRLLPDDVKIAIESELALHGWDNYVLTIGHCHNVEQHVLVVKLNHAEASQYA